LSKLRVSSFAISLDGFGAGPNNLQNPLGVVADPFGNLLGLIENPHFNAS